MDIEVRNNSYWMPNQGSFKERRISNFIIEGQYLVNSADIPARILVLKNEFGFIKTIMITAKDFASLQSFKALAEGSGNFIWMGTSKDLQLVKENVFEECENLAEIVELGWQSKYKIFAFANGVFDGYNFCETNHLGIVRLGAQAIFIPAFSDIYEDSTRFKAQRKFRHTKRNVDIKTWSHKFCKTYGPKAYVGIAYIIACIFRDIVFGEINSFPLLFLYGPPETGKSQFYYSLQKFFGERQTVINMESGSTSTASIRKLGQFNNSLVIFNEFKNSIDSRLVGLIKAVYDGDGKETGEYSNDTRTKQTKVSQGVVIAGQELPAQESAMFTRIILLSFEKKAFTLEEKEIFDQLHDYEGETKGGLTTCLLEILRSRETFEKEFAITYKTIYSHIKSVLDFKEARQASHLAILLASFKIVNSAIEFPFTYPELQDYLFKITQEQINYMEKSNELFIFWSAFSYLVSKYTLSKDMHYTIKVNQNRLWVRPQLFHPEYMEYCKKSGKPSLNELTLKKYLKDCQSYIGSDSQKFGPQNQWAMGFDLEYLKTHYRLELQF